MVAVLVVLIQNLVKIRPLGGWKWENLRSFILQEFSNVKIRPLGGWKYHSKYFGGKNEFIVKIRPLGGWKTIFIYYDA